MWIRWNFFHIGEVLKALKLISKCLFPADYFSQMYWSELILLAHWHSNCHLSHLLHHVMSSEKCNKIWFIFIFCFELSHTFLCCFVFLWVFCGFFFWVAIHGCVAFVLGNVSHLLLEFWFSTSNVLALMRYIHTYRSLTALVYCLLMDMKGK